MLKPIFVFHLFIASAYSIKCHKCGGAENIPVFAQKAFNELNITNGQMFGDCKSKAEEHTCQVDEHCVKQAHVYEIGYSGINVKWTTYTKGCAQNRVDTNEPANNECYDLGIVKNATGYNVRKVDCYCNEDFCNSSTMLSFMYASILAISWQFV